MVAVVGAKGPKRTPPLKAEERHKRDIERAKRKLLNTHLQQYHDPTNEFASFEIEASQIKENIDRLFKFLEEQRAKNEAELDKKYGKK